MTWKEEKPGMSQIAELKIIMLVLMRCIQVGMKMSMPTSASSCYPWFSGTMFRGDHFISIKLLL